MKKKIDFLSQLVDGVLNEFTYEEAVDGKQAGDKFYSMVLSPLFQSGNSIAVFPMPINNYDYYFDGSYRQQFAFQVMTKHTNQMEAYQTLQTITNLLRGIEDIPSENNSYEFEGITVTTDPNVIGKDEKYYQFSAQFNAGLYIKNEE